MGVGPHSVIGQNPDTPTLPFTLGTLNNQAALAAGAEVTVVVHTSRDIFVAPGTSVWIATVSPHLAEANVMYVAEVPATMNFAGLLSASVGIGVKVKNVGSAASAQQWDVALMGLPLGIA